MPLARSTYGLGLFALVAILVASVAVAATIRMRKGYALAVLLVLIGAIYVAGIIWNDQVVPDPTYDYGRHPFAGVGGLGTALTVLVDLGLFFIGGAAALIAAAIAHRWAWLAVIVAAMLPMLALALGGMLPTSPSSYAQNVVPFSAALFCSLLVCLAYACRGVASSVLPTREAERRQRHRQQG